MLKILNTILFLYLSLSSIAQIRLDSTNQHYFNYHDKPTVLITSGEHYGAVINNAFDYKKYLSTLHDIGLNHTRIFLGDYFEAEGAFCINNNTLAPKDNIICPWKRSSTAGYILGGNKFDLDHWDKAYFRRLTDFLQFAQEHNVTVEVVLFFASWTIENSPLYYKNNVNHIDSVSAQQYMTLNNGNLLQRQQDYTQKIIIEINSFDNVIINIANEPWFDNQAKPGFSSPTTTETKKWIKKISDYIIDIEKTLPKKHLISVDYCNEGIRIPQEDIQTYFKNISIFNHHYDKNAKSVHLNYKRIPRVFSFNETGLMPSTTPQYRIQGWKYLLSGGALYNNLDYTYQVQNEDGTGNSGFSCDWYSGCDDPKVKYQLANLLKFMNRIDFINMEPNPQIIIVNYGDENVYPLVNIGEEYALYFEGGRKAKIMLTIPNGNYTITWIDPSTLDTISLNEIQVTTSKTNLLGPEYSEDVLLYIKKIP